MKLMLDTHNSRRIHNAKKHVKLYCLGAICAMSAVFVGIEAVLNVYGKTWNEIFHVTSICS